MRFRRSWIYTALRLIQITDCHLARDPQHVLNGVETAASLAAVVAALRNEDMRCILATGDLSHDGSAESYRVFRQSLQGLDKPVLCLPGNHDLQPAFSAALNQPPFHCARAHILQGWQIILLDSSVAGQSGGHLAAAELAFLQQRLEAFPTHHALICLHHQPVPVGSAWMDVMAVDNPASLFAILAQFPQVRGMLWGHVHQDFEQQAHGLRLLGSPSTCIQFTPGSETFATDSLGPAYRWLELGDDGTLETGINYISRAGLI